MIDDESTIEEATDLDVYERWAEEIELAEKAEKDWRREADNTIRTYRSEKRKVNGEESGKTENFNILWANVETKRPALYNSVPRPDIRRRHRDKDKLGKAISELLERCVTYVVDAEDMNLANISAVNDMLVPGRAVTRIKYIPTMGQEEAEELAEGESAPESLEEPEDIVVNQQIRFDQVQWDEFHRGPGKSWDEVTWVCYDHRFTKEMAEEKWGEEVAKRLQYDINPGSQGAGKNDKDLDDTDASLFKRALIREIWDKEQRKVIWIADGQESAGALEENEDPLNLAGFFDIARPLYAIESSTSLIPIAEFTQYKILAMELEEITVRIRKIIAAVRVRAIYDSSIQEFSALFDSDDNDYVPANDLSRLIELGGLDKAIWMIPIQQIVETLQVLKLQRNALVQEIYELTGISDIQRGASNPHETKGAQEIKATFGGARLKRQQEEVQRFMRDNIRITVEIIAENFTRETLTMMSGLNFPTNEEKQQAQQLLIQAQQYQKMEQQQKQMAQQQPQGMPPMMGPQLPPPPDKKRLQQAQQTMGKVTWEQIEETMKSDLKRAYRIDIETDSTIQDELDQDQKDRTQLLTSIGQLLQTAQPAMQAGVMDREVLKELLLSTVRSAKLGRAAEDAIENMKPPQKKGPSPEEKQIQADMQIQQKEDQRAQQAHQAEMDIKQIDKQAAEQKSQAETRKLQMQEQADDKEHQQKMEALRMKDEYEAAAHQRKMRELNEPKRIHG